MALDASLRPTTSGLRLPTAGVSMGGAIGQELALAAPSACAP